MKVWILIALLFCCNLSKAQNNQTRFYGIEIDNLYSLSTKKAFVFQGAFDKQTFSCFYLADSMGYFRAYKADIISPVCDDTLCQIVSTSMYWDITGRYIGYSIHNEKPLTKFDHKEFSSHDYWKLHQLLNDQHSVLSQKRKEDLIDKSVQVQSEKYDATTGATALELKETVVEQASFTSFTLWYIANGIVNEKIKKFTKDNIGKSQSISLLESSNSNEQLLALQLLDSLDIHQNFDILLKILQSGIPLNKQYILKKLPGPIWETDQTQIAICNTFHELDSRSKSIVLQKIGNLNNPNQKSLIMLAASVSSLTKNQQKLYLNMLDKAFKKLPKEISVELQKNNLVKLPV